MKTKPITYALAFALILSNACWFRSYNAVNLEHIRMKGLVDHADTMMRMLPHADVYTVWALGDGSLGVFCRNAETPTLKGNGDRRVFISCNQEGR